MQLVKSGGMKRLCNWMRKQKNKKGDRTETGIEEEDSSKGTKKENETGRKSKEMDQVLELVKDWYSKCIHLKERKGERDREDEKEWKGTKLERTK